MKPWTQTPEAAALLAACAAHPPPRRLRVYRFRETAAFYAGPRMKQLRRLYRQAEPPLDTPEWRAWLTLDPERMVAEAIARAPAKAQSISRPGPSPANPTPPTSRWPVTAG